LSDKEKTQVDGWTTQAYAELKNDRIRKNIAEYEKSDPASVPSELHSILGTEVKNLPAPLETYYRRYFDDRSKVVAYSDTYESAFNARQAKIDQYEATLKRLQAEVEANNAYLKDENTALKQEYASLQSGRSNADPNTFNARVAAYNSRVRAYNAKVTETSSLIDSYNRTYAEYSSIVVEQQGLYGAIDSRPQKIQTQ
jgi:Skp family chaperone for outer membrane proteins